MKIGFVGADWSNTLAEDGMPIPGGACWYRMVLPAEELAKNGYDVVIGLQFRTKDGRVEVTDFFGEWHDDCDVVVFQRWMNEDAPRVFKGARACGQVVLNDVDDWFDGLSTSNAAWYVTHPKVDRSNNRDHYRKGLAASSGLTVSTPYLAERLEKLGVPVYVIRNAIRLKDFHPNPLIAEKPVIGWTGSTQHRSGDLEILKGVLGPFVKKHDLTCFHVGQIPNTPTFAELTGVDPERVNSCPLLPMTRYPAAFAQFDMMVLPLADNSFNSAKSYIKRLEASAAAIPSVASSMPDYEWFGAGPTCKRPRDWIKALERFLDPSERQLVGKLARERAVLEDIASRWTDWEKVYKLATP